MIASRTSKKVNAFPTGLIVIALSACASERVTDGRPAVTVDKLAPAAVGRLTPLIPVPKDAIHAGLIWLPGTAPKICFGMRPTEYRGSDLVTEDSRLKAIFQQLVYGGFGFGVGPHGLDASTARSDISRDNFVCWHLTQPDAFRDTGVFSILDNQGIPQVDKSDFALTRAAFSDAGASKELNYNLFCGGNVALPNGKWMFIGGHDKSGNNGIRKLNIFDPASETWADRGLPLVKKQFLEDPTGTAFPHVDANDEANTDPPHPSDMKYQRWYPSGAVLPDGDVLIVSGSDQDTSLGPPGTQFSPCQSRVQNAACSKVRQSVPEIYAASTDTTIALENAQKLFNMYPKTFVVQTGKGWNDWKVAVTGEVHESTLVSGTFLSPLSRVGRYDPFAYTGRTYYLDVRAARADANRNVPGRNHWQYVTEGRTAHDTGASAQLWELDHTGHAVAQRVATFGGGCGDVPTVNGQPIFECPQDMVEMINFQDANPTWVVQEPLVQPAQQNNAVALPDGEVLIVGGSLGRGPWTPTLVLQLFEPKKGHTRAGIEIGIPHHDHSTVALLPDGRVAIMGGNATDLANDVAHVDSAIPVVQIYDPPYLFRGPRPEVTSSPSSIKYGQRFDLGVDNSATIDSVRLIRMGPVTHNWDWGNRSIKLWFDRSGKSTIKAQAPAVPGLAVPGYYMLFAVNNAGVPAHAKLVHLAP